jgi:hypothetical protein
LSVVAVAAATQMGFNPIARLDVSYLRTVDGMEWLCMLAHVIVAVDVKGARQRGCSPTRALTNAAHPH